MPEYGPGVLFAPEAHAAMQRGINRLANLVRPTLGPTPRCVAVAHVSPSRAPEVLDDAATILRRVIQVPNPYVDMGAMLLRHTVWQTVEAVGEGAATTAVLLQALVREAVRYVAAGGDPVAVRRGLGRGRALATAALGNMARPVAGRAALERSAGVLCHDPDMARVLSEVLDIVGADGHVHIDTGYTDGLKRQLIDGTFWNEGFVSPHFITDQEKQESRLIEPAILLSDLRFTTAEQLIPLLERITNACIRSVMIVAREVSGSALGLLLANHQAGTLHSVAVKAPSHGRERVAILKDLAVLTGGRPIVEVAGERAEDVTLSDLGHARVAWATSKAFGLRAGKGDVHALRRHINDVRSELAAASDRTAQDSVRARLGKLMGGSAVLYVGAATVGEADTRKEGARRALAALRQALAGGVVPGGGRAYLLCQPALRGLDLPADELAGLRILERALEEPLRVIASNGGFDPASVVARLKHQAPECGFDARTGEMVDLWDAGILDPTLVLQKALEAAISGAIMAITTDVLIHRRKPLEVINP